MKKAYILLFGILAINSMKLHAQTFAIDQKAFILTLDASYVHQSNDLFNYFSRSDDPVDLVQSRIIYSYFLIKGLFFGGSIEMNFDFNKIADRYELSVGPHIGYAFGGENTSIYPYISLGIRYMYWKGLRNSIWYSGPVSMSKNCLDIPIDIGIIVPLKGYIGLSISAGLNYVIEEGVDQLEEIKNYDSTVFSFRVGLSGLFY